MADELTVTLRINADGSGLSAVLRTAQADVNNFAKSSEAVGKQAAAGLDKAASSARDFAKELGQLSVQWKDILSPIEKGAEGAVNQLGHVGEQGSKAFGLLGGSVAGVTRELAVMTGEALRGNYTRLIGSTTVLANRTGVLPGLISAMINPYVAVGVAAAAALAIITVKSIQAAQYSEQLGNAINGTNGYALQSTQALVGLAQSVSDVGVKYKDAKAEVLSLASSGKFAGDQLTSAALAAANMSQLFGIKIAEAGKQVEKLGEKPLQGLIELNNQTHLISINAISATASAEALGNKFLAVSIATDAIADATAKALAQQKDFNKELQQSKDEDALVRTMAGLDGEAEAATRAAEAERTLNQARNLPNLVATDTVAALIPAIQKEIDKVELATATYGKGKAAIAEYSAEKMRLALASNIGSAAEATFNEELKRGVPFAQALADSYKAANAALASSGSTLDALLKKWIDGAKAEDAAIASDKARKKALEEQAAAARKLTDSDLSLQSMIDKNADSTSGITKANADYDAGLKKLIDISAIYNDANKLTEDRLTNLDTAFDELNNKKQEAIDKANELIAVYQIEGTSLDKEQKQFEASLAAIHDYTGLKDKDIAVSKAAAKAEIDWKQSIVQSRAAGDAANVDYLLSHHDMIVKNAQDNAAMLYDEQNVYNRIKQVRQDSINIFSSGLDSVGKSIADFATGGIKKWSDFGKALVGDTKQFIAAMIQEFLKLAIFNGIINSVFGLSGTSSELATFANLGASAAGGAAGGGGAGSLLSSGSSLFSLGSKLFGGGAGAAGAGGAYSGASSAISGSGLGAEYGTTSAFGGASGTGAGGFFSGSSGTSIFGSAAGWAGAAGGALYGLQQGDGGIGTVASTAAGAVAGASIATAVSAGMGAGISAGLAAVPVVGWIALAALVVDKVSGGKLFGTKFQTKNTDTTLAFNSEGGTASATKYETRQKFLFGGIKKKTTDIDPGQGAKDLASHIFDNETTAITTQAKILGKTAGDLVAGTFDTITEYTKKGAVKSTKTISEFFGVKYTEDLTAFTQRYAAENTIALLDQGDNAQTASNLAAKYRGTASELLDAAQTLFAVTVDLKNGNNILNDTGATLTDTFTEVQKFQASGEALLQTYARLEGETQNINALFTDVGDKMVLTGDAFLQFSDDLATAFGGLQNESAALSQFYQEFFQVGNGAVNQLGAIWASANAQLTKIGETAGETTEQFAADFTAALPNLTPEQIAQWVAAGNALYNATKAQDAYNQALRQYADFSAGLAEQAGTYTKYEASLRQIDNTLHDNIDQANKLAQSAGKAGASEEDLSNIRAIATQQEAAALAQLEQDTLDLINTLGLSTDGVVAASDSASQSFSSVASSAHSAADAAKSLYDAQINAIKQVKDFLNSILLDTAVSTLTPQQRLDAAAGIYQSTLAGANSGNADDMANLTKTAQDYLSAAREFYSSSDSYTAIFNAVRDGLSGFASHSPTAPPGGNTGGSHFTGGSSSTSNAFATGGVSPLQTQINLQALIGNIRDLITATGTPLKGLITELHLDFPKLVKGLGIDIGDKSVSTTERLAALSQQLGVPLSELASQLGYGIGDLTNKTSLQALALQDKITKLPKADSDALTPLFKAVTSATNKADANAAIQTLTDYVNTLPEAEKEQLAPFLAGVSLTGPLDYLTDINDSGKVTADQVTKLNDTFKHPIRVTVTDPDSGTKVPGDGGSTTPGSGSTGPVGGGGSGGGGGGGSGPIGPKPLSVTIPTQNAIVASSTTTTHAVTDQTRVLTQMLAELRSLRTDAKTDPRVASLISRVGDKLDTVISSNNGISNSISRQTDALKIRR
jgi:hypothetical protein